MTTISKSRVSTFLSYSKPIVFSSTSCNENGERFHPRMVEESQDARVRLHHNATSYISSVQSLSKKEGWTTRNMV
jgi:hypothetical protein